MNAGPVAFQFQEQLFCTMHRPFMSKNATLGRFLHLLLQVLTGSRSLWSGMGCLWGTEPLNCRKTKTDVSTSSTPTSIIYLTSMTTAKQAFLQSWWHYCHGQNSCLARYVVQHYCWPRGTNINLTEDKRTQEVQSLCFTAEVDETELKPFIFLPGAQRETKHNEEFKKSAM